MAPYKKIIVRSILFCALASISGAALPAYAQTTTSRVEVTPTLERLKTEVARLQQQLAAMLASEKSAKPLPTGPYNLRFFDRSFDSIYRVEGDSVVRIGGRNNSVHGDEKKLFALLVGVAGESALNTYVHEWRVFSDKGTDLGAFVESIAGTDKWVVGVNRANYDDQDDDSEEAFIELLTHEFAHILLNKESAFAKAFKENFWTEADIAHANRIKKIDFDDRTQELDAYFIKNERRFVSDYATSNVDEDMAETFVEFVFNDRPSNQLVRNQKVLSFYQDPELVAARQGIVERLTDLGVY